MKRTLAAYDSGHQGPLLVVIVGIHGNEPAGGKAAQRVVATLETGTVPLRGRVVAVVGNLEASRRGVRYLEEDLNRIWPSIDIERDDRRPISAEDREREALMRHLETEMRESSAPPVFLDLHSMSGPGAPFCVISDTLQNRRLAFALGIPVILGLEEAIDGTVLNYFGERGFVGVGVEGGQHDDPATVDNHESIIWMALASAGLVEVGAVRDHAAHLARLRRATRGLPAIVEIVHRHGTAAGDDFRMMEGLSTFSPVARGEVLAHDHGGAIASDHSGYVLLPRYQGSGDDGFFLGRTVRPFWLALSRHLRGVNGERILPLLPGVSRHPARPHTLRVDPRTARWLPVEIFHLFGFRKLKNEGRCLVFSRRPEGPAA